MTAGNFRKPRGLPQTESRPKSPAREMPSALDNGVHCLQPLGRVNEIDDFREKFVEVHKDNWRLLQAAAQSYLNIEHNGVIIAGKFSSRGPHRVAMAGTFMRRNGIASEHCSCSRSVAVGSEG